ncbi:MAG: mucoidy inhibitor MuiA family protein [Chitinophagaceae bacterium]|jgi:TonB-dependent SusC/RagA subfamily outer membrane receptor|nr:mucoidy inhibitor MuiA family protein [Chitinophagaceae bacterium]
MQKLIFSFVFTFSFVFVFAEGEKQNVPASLQSVMVYYSGAEITHTATVQLKPGNNELVIENIANAIDINSIRIKAPSGATVSGIEFSNNYLPETKKAAISARTIFLQDSLEHLQNNLSRIDQSLSTIVELKELLKSNRDIKGTQTGLSVAELTKMVVYYKNKMQELQEDYLELQSKKNKTNELIKNVQAQINEEQTKNSLPAGRLSLQIYAATESNATLLISYIAKNAGWTPCYDVNVESTKSPLKIIYKAKIFQTTGMDWKRTKLSLSTGTPAQYGSAPELQSWYVGYQNPAIRIRGQSSMLSGTVPGVQLNDVVVVGYGTKKDKDENDTVEATEPIYVVNGNIMSKGEFQNIDPNTIKKMEVLKSDNATAIYGSRAAAGAIIITLKSGMEDYVTTTDKGLNTVFDLDIPFDIPATGKEQTAVIKATEAPAIYSHFSVPSLDTKAYLTANIPDWEKQNLLPGEANIIYENTYLGKTFINPNDVKDTFSLTLSDDKRISIKREKLNDFSSVKFLSNYKLQKFVYEITVKNNKNEAVTITLKDRYPLSTDKDIEVELLENGNAAVNKETGLLNWKINLAAGEVKKLRFAYSIKYAKDKIINLN